MIDLKQTSPLIHIVHQQQLYAIIIRHDLPTEPEVRFFTPPEFSQQLALMHHPVGKIIEPHLHNPIPREVCYTQEVLVIRKGRLRVDFYDDNANYLESYLLSAGDLILLAKGGHGFEVLEEVEMIEVKQGPYTGIQDKTRIKPVENFKIRVKDDSL